MLHNEECYVLSYNFDFALQIDYTKVGTLGGGMWLWGANQIVL